MRHLGTYTNTISVSPRAPLSLVREETAHNFIMAILHSLYN